MSQSKVSLSWNAYKGNVCNGFSTLQQSGEFVDMTLAADGHFVKVHQVILALASPYIKELISSIQCPHPVLFLNKISYTTLSLILEYVYTGEVMVSLENITELLVAGRELHIKGLEDMDYKVTLPDATRTIHTNILTNKKRTSEEKGQLKLSDGKDQKETDSQCTYNEQLNEDPNIENKSDVIKFNIEYVASDNNNTEMQDETQNEEHTSVASNLSPTSPSTQGSQLLENKNTTHTGLPKPNSVQLQYTVSNQGNLQIILNRFTYNLRYTGKTGHRQWRCTDYGSRLKCPALVVTKDNLVLRRTGAHVHPFHDKKIARRVLANAIFSVIAEAEKQAEQLKHKKSSDVDD